MPDRHELILSNLRPDDPASIAALLEFHREMFGGWRMEETGDATPPASDQTPAGQPASTPAQPDADEPLREPGLKALQSERARAEKAEAALAALTKQVEDSKKSAEQKTADDLAAARAEATANAAKALRYEVAAAKGLDLKFALRLTGSTKAELEADADAFKALIGQQQGTPRPDPAQGGGAGKKDDPRDVGHAEAARRFGNPNKQS